MKKHLFIIAALTALATMVSCSKDENKSKKDDNTIDRAVVHCKLDFDFNIPSITGMLTYSTSFDCLDVKAVCTVNGTEKANDAVNALAKSWSKDIEITSTSTIEIHPVYALKKEFEANLPEKLTAAGICDFEELVTSISPYFVVDYYSGSTFIKTDKVISSTGVSLGAGYRAQENGLDKTKEYLGKQGSRNKYSVTITM